jgi:hypothetical protein
VPAAVAATVKVKSNFWPAARLTIPKSSVRPPRTGSPRPCVDPATYSTPGGSVAVSGSITWVNGLGFSTVTDTVVCPPTWSESALSETDDGSGSTLVGAKLVPSETVVEVSGSRLRLQLSPMALSTAGSSPLSTASGKGSCAPTTDHTCAASPYR